MTTIEYFDGRAEAFRLRMLQRDMEMAEREGLAMQAALSEHSVVSFIKGLRVESSLYPAIEYLKQSTQTSKENNQETYQETTIQEDIPTIYHEYIQWCMPAHDQERPKRKGCGFIRSKSGKGIVYSACPNEKEHYIKGKRMYCWSLRCPQCMNDTALKKGVEMEKKLLLYKGLSKKQGRDVGEIGHWVVSPPQEFAKHMVQTREEFDTLCKHIDNSMIVNGATAGITIFHPWRQKEDEWEFSPHFHMLCYGRINTTKFRKQNPGWIIKKVHAKEKIRSIRHTAAYLMTHMGLGHSEIDPDSVDWDMRFLDHMIPGILSPGASYSEKDYKEKSENKGRMVGDLSDIKWEEWTMDKLFTDLKIRYWREIARNKIVEIGKFRQYKIRVCKECNEILRTYDGYDDSIGSFIRYIQDNPVVAFAQHAQQVKMIFQRFKARLRENDMTIINLAKLTPLAISSLELELVMNKDLVMATPFEEPDEYFLRRQKEAFGE